MLLDDRTFWCLIYNRQLYHYVRKGFSCCYETRHVRILSSVRVRVSVCLRLRVRPSVRACVCQQGLCRPLTIRRVQSV